MILRSTFKEKTDRQRTEQNNKGKCPFFEDQNHIVEQKTEGWTKTSKLDKECPGSPRFDCQVIYHLLNTYATYFMNTHNQVHFILTDHNSGLNVAKISTQWPQAEDGVAHSHLHSQIPIHTMKLYHRKSDYLKCFGCAFVCVSIFYSGHYLVA